MSLEKDTYSRIKAIGSEQLKIPSCWRLVNNFNFIINKFLKVNNLFCPFTLSHFNKMSIHKSGKTYLCYANNAYKIQSQKTC